MYHKIKEAIYRVKDVRGVPCFVECSSLEELYHYIAKECIMKGYPVGSVNRIEIDGSTPKVKVLTNRDFKKVLANHQNFDYAVETLKKAGYEVIVYNNRTKPEARVYYKDKPGFTEITPCDSLAHGYITIEGKKQHIDKWI